MFPKGGHTNVILSTNSFIITVFSFQYTDSAMCKTEQPCSAQERNLQVQDEDEPRVGNLIFKKKSPYHPRSSFLDRDIICLKGYFKN